jgi:AraC-like DNA-binding protein
MAKAGILRQRWEQLAEPAHYDARELAQLCQISTRQLQREFRRCLGCSPQSWLNQQRIMAAQRLLLAGWPVKAVGYELGFKQTSHFCRQFKSLNHLTPSEFVLRQTQMSGVVAQG